MEKKYIRKIILDRDIEQRVALADVAVGDVLITGIHIRRLDSGRLQVRFPGYEGHGHYIENSVIVPAEVRSEIDAELIAEYREQRREMEREADTMKQR